METRVVSANQPVTSPQATGEPAEVSTQGHFLNLRNGQLHLRLNKRRGLAIDRLALAASPGLSLCGTLPHGFFDDIGYGADWYSGNATFETPGAHKIADLNPVDPVIRQTTDGRTTLSAKVQTPRGPICKSLTLSNDKPEIEFDIAFDWQDWPRGSLRLGNFTLIPSSFDRKSLSFSSHNGGNEPEEFPLAGQDIDHGAPVSFLVSASSGLGLTDGTIDIGDARHRLKVSVDMGCAALLGLVTHKPVGDSLFCRLALSALEMDETRDPFATDTGPRRFRFTLSVIPGSG